MGSPLGCILAEIFMGYIGMTENRETADLVKCIANLNARINRMHPNIQRRAEYENEQIMPFVDVLL